MKINTNKPIAAKRVMLTNFNSAISFFRITGVSPIPKINDHKVLLTKKLVSSSGRVEKNVCLTMLANESPKTIKYIINLKEAIDIIITMYTMDTLHQLKSTYEFIQWHAF